MEKPKVELKTLPAHMKYVFLEYNEAKPVIISSSLQKKEEDQLVQILKSPKAAIGWHISDLKGISPSYCMHKINMETDYNNERRSKKGSAQVVGSRAYLSNLRQFMGQSCSSCSEKGSYDSDKE